MREILFRGKRYDNKEWIEGNLFVPHLLECGEFQIFTGVTDFFRAVHDVKANTVGQYTGIKDKNGDKIFEGDILRFMIPDTGEWSKNITEIYWGDSGWYFKEIRPNGGCTEPDIFSECMGKEYEIIGNIYDNPELLKGGDNND